MKKHMLIMTTIFTINYFAISYSSEQLQPSTTSTSRHGSGLEETYNAMIAAQSYKTHDDKKQELVRIKYEETQEQLDSDMELIEDLFRLQELP